MTLMDSRPLIPGPKGKVYVHTGGALMLLAEDLSSARTISSMREELWLVDNDEGTPEYPISFHVFGVGLDGKVYRSLRRTDYTGLVLLRRLQISNDLRQARSKIRDLAPSLWPKINDDRVGEQWARRRNEVDPEKALIFPDHYTETDRDKWDGKKTWLTDPWIWQDIETSSRPAKLRMHGHHFQTFYDFMGRCKYEDYWFTEEYQAANWELEQRRSDLPAEVTLPSHAHPLKSQEMGEIGGYDCDVCRQKNRRSWFEFEEWGYVCAACHFHCHPFCALPEERQKRDELEAGWLEGGREAFEEIPVVLDLTSLETSED